MKKKRNQWHGVLGGVLAALSLGAIGVIGYLYITLSETCCADEQLCPKNGPTGYVAILLDATDAIEPGLSDALRTELHKIVLTSEPGTLITLTLVAPRSEREGWAIARCHPGNPGQANPLYQNPDQIAEQFQHDFLNPLSTQLDRLLNAELADSSPIAESIQSIVHTVFAKADIGHSKRLVIVSDLVQHSPAFSFYRADTWARFEASPNFNRLGRTLNGIDVQILKIPRVASRRNGTRISDADVWEFWVNYFDVQGAVSLDRHTKIGDL